VLALMLCGVAGDAAAKCAQNWLRFHVDANSLPTNGQLVVEVGSMAEELEAQLAQATLDAPGDVVPLKVVSTSEGDGQHQLVLAPVRPLKAGASYTLQAPQDAKALINALHGAGARTWKVGAQADSRPPEWSSTPVSGPTQVEELGCGPDVQLKVLEVRADEPGGWFEVTVSVNGRRSLQRVQAVAGVLSVGHGMCSGPFWVPPEAKLEVTLVPIDQAGNRGAPKSLTLTSPKW
jgi:hypothetical protein